MIFRSVNFEEILKRLKDKKRLIVGNHDGSWVTKADISRYFESIDKFLEPPTGSTPCPCATPPCSRESMPGDPI